MNAFTNAIDELMTSERPRKGAGWMGGSPYMLLVPMGCDRGGGAIEEDGDCSMRVACVRSSR
jgi:hypothetical protein